MLRLFHLILFLAAVCQLHGQDPVLRTAESLRNNVVRLSVSFPDGSKQEGFGFITGEKNGLLYLATAAHVVHGEEFNQKPSLIQVWFYADYKAYTAEAIRFFEAQDLALLQMPKPGALDYKNTNWADFAPQNYQAVRFVGRQGEWLIPGQGEVYKIGNDRIVASMTTVRPGTSGAPLINSNGVIGLIIADDNQEVTAIALSKIRELFADGGRFPYFNASGERPIDNPVLTTPSNGNDLSAYNMVKIEGGKFRMGCLKTRDGSCEGDETPDHEVSISSFYLSKYEVTFKQFKTFVEATKYQTDADKNGYSRVWTGSKWEDKKGANWKADVAGNPRSASEFEHPVIHVSQNDAVAYCRWLSQQTGKTYRLPVEAEWEYAARGGKLSKGYKYAGSNDIKEVAWYDGNSNNTTHKVGGLRANELSLYDMSGNVWEWCSDWYASDYYKNSPASNPKGPSSGTYSVLRGGSWNDDYSRVANRGSLVGPRYSNDTFGFRLARDL